MEIISDSVSLDKTGKKDCTSLLQNLIEKTQRGTLIINKGIYLTGPLFLHSHMNLVLEEGVVLLAQTDEALYKLIPTRVAGIEMNWYPAVLNVLNCEGVSVGGLGAINGNGPFWWNKYWGKDAKGGYRGRYDSAGLRWAADYDCMRPRNLLISNSHNVRIDGISLVESGFWNLHVLYSDEVEISNVKISCSQMNTPSTDGIDIDSSSQVSVHGCLIDCGDDSICVKSGRDYDGLRVNIPSHDIEIYDCSFRSGFGVTIGSEVSGGIENINIHNLVFSSTGCGFRIKSSSCRSGFIKNIRVSHLKMTDVSYLFNIYLDWNPSYCLCRIPSSYEGEIKEHYKALCHPLDKAQKKTLVAGIDISNIESSYSAGYKGVNRVFQIVGYPDQMIEGLSFSHLKIKAKEKGIIRYCKPVAFIDCAIDCVTEHISANDEFDNR